jgi:hypothetical protein
MLIVIILAIITASVGFLSPADPHGLCKLATPYSYIFLVCLGLTCLFLLGVFCHAAGHQKSDQPTTLQ